MTTQMTSSRPYMIRALYEWIVENDLTPYLLVDALVAGVEVPQEFVKDGQIVLNVAPRAVRELLMDNQVIMFMSRFGGISRQLSVPTSAVLAIYAKENGRGMVFEVEEPSTPPPPTPTKLTLTKTKSKPKTDKAVTKTTKSSKPSLKVVK